MIRHLFATTALCAATLTVAPPARAADVASLSCIQQQAGAATIAGFVDKISADLLAKSPNALTPDWSALRAPAGACKTSNKWSQKATELAAMITIATIFRDATLRTLQREGADVGLIQRLFRGLPANARHAFLDNATMAQGVKAFEPVLRQNGIDPNGKFGQHIGVLAGALAMLEFRPAEFAAA